MLNLPLPLFGTLFCFWMTMFLKSFERFSYITSGSYGSGTTSLVLTIPLPVKTSSSPSRRTPRRQNIVMNSRKVIGVRGSFGYCSEKRVIKKSSDSYSPSTVSLTIFSSLTSSNQSSSTMFMKQVSMGTVSRSSLPSSLLLVNTRFKLSSMSQERQTSTSLLIRTSASFSIWPRVLSLACWRLCSQMLF